MTTADWGTIPCLHHGFPRAHALEQQGLVAAFVISPRLFSYKQSSILHLSFAAITLISVEVNRFTEPSTTVKSNSGQAYPRNRLLRVRFVSWDACYTRRTLYVV